jgi:hypothetical protein
MDKRHGGMSSSMGMDSAMGVMFMPGNRALAETYWYMIAAVLAFTVIIQIADWVQTSLRSVTSYELAWSAV